MAPTQRSRPISAVLLLLFVGFQALSGLFGGGILVLDPTGGLLRLPVSVLDRTPFADFLVPGLILFLVLGIAPAAITVALWSKPAWSAAAWVEHAFGEHWTWVGAGVVGVGLLIWLAVELWLVGYSFLLFVYGVVGVLILVVALMPSTKRFYQV